MNNTLYLIVHNDGNLAFHHLNATPGADNTKRIRSLMKIHGYTDQDAWLMNITTTGDEIAMINDTKFTYLTDYEKG